jgi:hypothetical protein
MNETRNETAAAGISILTMLTERQASGKSPGVCKITDCRG